MSFVHLRLFVAVLFIGVILRLTPAYAVVNDVSISGLPPEQTFTIVNTKTGEKQEGKSNKDGVLVIVVPAGKKWDAGSHYHLRGGGGLSRALTLRDGSTAINLALTGAAIGTNNAFELQLGAYYPGSGQKDVGTSFEFKFNYTLPWSLCCANTTFSLRPYFTFAGVPNMTTPSVRRLDFDGRFQAEVENAHKYGVRTGLKGVAPLAQIGDATLVGVGQFGVGTEYSSADLHRFSDVAPFWRDAHNFDKTSWGFLFDIEAGLSIRYRRGFFWGLRAALLPTHDDWLNGGAKFRTHGESGMVLGFVF